MKRMQAEPPDMGHYSTAEKTIKTITTMHVGKKETRRPILRNASDYHTVSTRAGYTSSASLITAHNTEGMSKKHRVVKSMQYTDIAYVHDEQ